MVVLAAHTETVWTSRRPGWQVRNKSQIVFLNGGLGVVMGVEVGGCGAWGGVGWVGWVVRVGWVGGWVGAWLGRGGCLEWGGVGWGGSRSRFPRARWGVVLVVLAAHTETFWTHRRPGWQVRSRSRTVFLIGGWGLGVGVRLGAWGAWGGVGWLGWMSWVGGIGGVGGWVGPWPGHSQAMAWPWPGNGWGQAVWLGKIKGRKVLVYIWGVRAGEIIYTRYYPPNLP